MRKTVIEIIAFIVVIAVLWNIGFKVLSYKDTGGGGGFQNFYETGNDLIDVLVLGSSHAHCTVNNAKLWDDAGISSFTLSSGNQGIGTTWVFLKEAFKTQHPKVVLIETYTIGNADAGMDIANLYRADLLPKWSPSILGYVWGQKKDCEFDNTLLGELILRFPIIHSRYDELNSLDYVNSYWFKRGYIGSGEVGPIDEPVVSSNVAELDGKTIKYLDKIVDKCNEEGAKLIFFCAPYNISEEEYTYQNAIGEYAASKNVDYINMNSPEISSAFDFGSDFRGDDHLSNSGANKATDIIEAIILEKCNLKDHRGELKYTAWDYDSLYIQDRLLYQTLSSPETDIYTYVNNLKNDDIGKYKIVVALAGNYTALGEENYSMLEGLGISSDEFAQGEVFEVEGESLVNHIVPENSYYVSKLGTNECSVTYTDDGQCQLYYGLEEYASVENGLVMIVYDTTLENPLDAIIIDFYNYGTIVTRKDDILTIGN